MLFAVSAVLIGVIGIFYVRRRSSRKKERVGADRVFLDGTRIARIPLLDGTRITRIPSRSTDADSRGSHPSTGRGFR